MNDSILLLLVTGLLVLIAIILKPPACDHAERVYFDAAGDELPGDQSEACFYKCLKCGQVFVIPGGFQGDAHFENYLHESEVGGSQAVKKIQGD